MKLSTLVEQFENNAGLSKESAWELTWEAGVSAFPVVPNVTVWDDGMLEIARRDRIEEHGHLFGCEFRVDSKGAGLLGWWVLCSVMTLQAERGKRSLDGAGFTGTEFAGLAVSSRGPQCSTHGWVPSSFLWEPCTVGDALDLASEEGWTDVNLRIVDNDGVNSLEWAGSQEALVALARVFLAFAWEADLNYEHLVYDGGVFGDGESIEYRLVRV